MRLAVSSDLHFDDRGHLTSGEAIERVARSLAAERPDMIVLAGDIGHGLDNIRGGITPFVGRAAQVAVVAGNHDVWRDKKRQLGSHELFERAIPELCADLGVTWLETTTLRHERVAVVGSMAWYDYSAIDPSQAHKASLAATLKRQFNADAHQVDWAATDLEMASHLADRLMDRISLLERDPSIDTIAVVTHVPLLDEQMTRKPRDPHWSFSNAYFGHLTLGVRVAACPKVTLVVSGHTHGARSAVRDRPGMRPLRSAVIGSDYGAPVGEVFEV